MDRYVLHYTVLDGDETAIKKAILQCIDIDERDDMGYTALHWAVINKQFNIVQLLLEAGADTSVISSHGFTPKENAIDFDFYEIEQLLAVYEKRRPQYLKVG